MKIATGRYAPSAARPRQRRIIATLVLATRLATRADTPEMYLIHTTTPATPSATPAVIQERLQITFTATAVIPPATFAVIRETT